MTENQSKSAYYKTITFPIIWIALMTSLLGFGMVKAKYADYFYCLYFGGLFFYGVFVKRAISLKAWHRTIKNKAFWQHVLCTLLIISTMYVIGSLPNVLFPGHNHIFIHLDHLRRAYNLPTIIAFVFSAMVFPAAGQEIVFRGMMIRRYNRKWTLCTVLISSLLFALNDSLDLFGIIQSFFLGIGFAIAYIKTNNIYVPITAHYIASICVTGISLVL